MQRSGTQRNAAQRDVTERKGEKMLSFVYIGGSGRPTKHTNEKVVAVPKKSFDSRANRSTYSVTRR
jgi:hypothetical protein